MPNEAEASFSELNQKGTSSITFAKVWERAVVSTPDAPFLIFEQPASTVPPSTIPPSTIPPSTAWTYERFDQDVQRVAARFDTLGVTAGSSVHLALSNSPTFVATWLAATRLGAWIVPSDPMAQVNELADHLRRTRPVVGLCSSERTDTYRAAVVAAEIELEIIEIDEADVGLIPFPDTGFDQWASPELTDRAAVLFTSGTTGQPKGVEITQANYAFTGKTMAVATQLEASDRHLVVLPLFHANAQYYSFSSAIWAGASVALMPTFSASGFLDQAARYQATVASLSAAPLRMILARGGPVDGVVLRHCWFAQNITDEQHQTVSQWFGCAPRQLYGMTETIPAVLTDRAEQPQPESMGSVTPGCEVQIHDSTGEPTGPDVSGSIVVKGERGITLFAGYLNDPETTGANFQGDWFVTGDQGRRDSDGRFFFEGRRSDVLKVAGENVSTIEVQLVLAEHPDLLEVAVIGVPDPIRDEVPVAFVVAADPTNPPSVDGLASWCEMRLAKAKRPRQLGFEKKALFLREWLCVGRSERIPNTGDWFTVTLVDEPLIVTRDKNGQIQCLSAVCQHRAMQVCEGEGNCSTFKCPYHHWTYALDGRLLGAPAMERTEDFEKKDYGLPKLKVEEWMGFVFVNFDLDAEPLAPTLSRYEPYLPNYHLEEAVCPGTFTLEGLPWNWKVMFENFNDGYHANRLHQFVQDFCPSSMSEFPVPWSDDSNVVFRVAGYTHMDGGFNATHRVIMPVFPDLTEEERTRSTFALIPPTLCFGTAADQCFFFLIRPTGPETIDVEIGYIFYPSALEDPLFEQKLALSDAGVQVFVDQDQDATMKVQRGLRSQFAPRGRYSWQEESHVQFNQWLVKRYEEQWPQSK